MISNIRLKKINTDITSIIIDEPKTYNSLSFQNLRDLIKAFKKLDKDRNVKVIIIEGSGKGFSAGHNLKEVKSLALNPVLIISFIESTKTRFEAG